MNNLIDVSTGEVKSGDRNCVLKSNAIGSCIVVTAYDPTNLNGAMAHIMLPGKCPVKSILSKNKYAENAIENLLSLMKKGEVSCPGIEICLIGGANVLKRKDDYIAENIIKSVEHNFYELGIHIKARALGGTERRSAKLEVATGRVYYSQGNSKEMLLWESIKTQVE